MNPTCTLCNSKIIIFDEDNEDEGYEQSNGRHMANYSNGDIVGFGCCTECPSYYFSCPNEKCSEETSSTVLCQFIGYDNCEYSEQYDIMPRNIKHITNTTIDSASNGVFNPALELSAYEYILNMGSDTITHKEFGISNTILYDAKINGDPVELSKLNIVYNLYGFDLMRLINPVNSFIINNDDIKIYLLIDEHRIPFNIDYEAFIPLIGIKDSKLSIVFEDKTCTEIRPIKLSIKHYWLDSNTKKNIENKPIRISDYNLIIRDN